MEIKLVRHGQADYSFWDNLTENGQKQAEITKDFLGTPKLIVYSKFKRSLLTAIPLIQKSIESRVELWEVEEFPSNPNETMENFIARVKNFLTKILDRGTKVVVFSHGLFIQTLISLIRKEKVLVPNCSIVTITLVDGTLKITDPDTSHLSSDLITY